MPVWCSSGEDSPWSYYVLRVFGPAEACGLLYQQLLATYSLVPQGSRWGSFTELSPNSPATSLKFTG